MGIICVCLVPGGEGGLWELLLRRSKDQTLIHRRVRVARWERRHENYSLNWSQTAFEFQSTSLLFGGSRPARTFVPFFPFSVCWVSYIAGPPPLPFWHDRLGVAASQANSKQARATKIPFLAHPPTHHPPLIFCKQGRDSTIMYTKRNYSFLEPYGINGFVSFLNSIGETAFTSLQKCACHPFHSDKQRERNNQPCVICWERKQSQPDRPSPPPPPRCYPIPLMGASRKERGGGGLAKKRSRVGKADDSWERRKDDWQI